MNRLTFLKRVFAAGSMSDDVSDEEVVTLKQGPQDDSGGDDDADNVVNLDEMLGFMQQLKQSGVTLTAKGRGKKKLACLSKMLQDNGAGPSTSRGTALDTEAPTDAAAAAISAPAITAATTTPAMAAAALTSAPAAATTVTTVDDATTVTSPAAILTASIAVSTPADPATSVPSAAAVNAASDSPTAPLPAPSLAVEEEAATAIFDGSVVTAPAAATANAAA
ncbi:unnamed protein product [Closterium sp. Yama58-4]|nr:unnamed protein product [Closterium sp. Yama58-4]